MPTIKNIMNTLAKSSINHWGINTLNSLHQYLENTYIT